MFNLYEKEKAVHNAAFSLTERIIYSTLSYQLNALVRQ